MKAVLGFWKKLSLLNKLLIGMVLGVILGIAFGESILVIRPLGTIFLNLLKMVALPLVVCSLISGISSVNDMGVFGRCGLKIIVYYFITTMVAAAVGLLLATILKPGEGFVLDGNYEAAVAEVPGVLDTIVNMVPSNIFSSLANGSYDHAVVFSILVGVGIILMPKEKGKRIHDFFDMIAEMLGYVLKIIFGYAPIGVGALIACCVGEYGSMFFSFAVKFLATNYLAVFVMIAIYFVALSVFSKRNPWKTLKGALPSMMTAFGTQSSAATLPVNMQCAEALGADKSVYGFTLPLGCQINKDGTAILLGASFLFAAQAVGVSVGIGTMIKVILLALLLTTGSTAVAGGAVIVVTILIETFGLPVETVAVVSGALALIDGILTTGNTLGDLVGTLIVSDSERKREGKQVKGEAQ